MAKDCSFDVVSEVDMQEADNAVNQTVKEINTEAQTVMLKSSLQMEKTQ